LFHTVKYKIEFRRTQIVRIQTHLRKCVALCKYRPLIRGLLQVKQLIALSEQLSTEISQLEDERTKQRIAAELQQIRVDVQHLQAKLRNNQLDDGTVKAGGKLNAEHAERSQRVESMVKGLRERLQRIVESLKQLLLQQQQLLQMQNQLDEEKKRLELEEQRRQQEQDRLRKKEQIEERRKQQELRELQQQVRQPSPHMFRQLIELTSFQHKAQQMQGQPIPRQNGDQFSLTEQIVREDEQLRDKLQQEQADHELAVRLAGQMSTNGAGSCDLAGGTEISYATVNLNKLKLEPGQRLDLSKWKYSELRDIINTSCDLMLLECCRNEFHRRLKVYHAWKSRNSQHQNNSRTVAGGEQRAPDSIMQQSECFT
jgi:myosin-6